MAIDLKAAIRTVPDFPRAGIMFRDITTLFADAQAFDASIVQLAEQLAFVEPSVIAGVEARGFVLGGAVAAKLGTGFVPIRKAGKLPWRTLAEDYELEYGKATLELHTDAVAPGTRVAIIDDLIATGGTALASISLVRRLNATPVAFAAVIDLPDLGGAKRILAADVPVHTLVEYSGH
jgi:adenine phosphoribosyltransferase